MFLFLALFFYITKNCAGGEDADSVISADQLKKYIAYCRAKCFPRLSSEVHFFVHSRTFACVNIYCNVFLFLWQAAELLKNRYVTFRNAMR